MIEIFLDKDEFFASKVEHYFGEMVCFFRRRKFMQLLLLHLLSVYSRHILENLLKLPKIVR